MSTPEVELEPWPELQALLPPLSRSQYEELKDSIRQDGLKVPILCLPDGRICDGLHRWTICQELGVSPEVQVLQVDEATGLRLGLTLNLARRHLTFEQLQEVRRWQRDTYLKYRREGLTQAEAAGRVGVAQRTGSFWERQNRGASKVSFPDLRVKVGQQARKEIVRRATSGERIEQIAADFGITARHVRRIVAEFEDRKVQLPEGGQREPDCTVHTGDLSILGELLPDNSVHLFIVDPPWGGDSVHLYSRVAELAAKKLVPGGLCVAFTGKYHLPEALARMLAHLSYYWVFAFELSDKHPVAWDKKIWSSWRPLIVARKGGGGERRGEWLSDLLPSGKMDKRYHPWQQSLIPVKYLVEKLTVPGDLVVDCCAGSGTTGVACKLTNRRFVGVELDPELARVAAARIAAIELGFDAFSTGPT